MRHITPAGLDQLEPLLAQLRGIEGLRETRRGAFSYKSRAFLHFHEDPAGLFADVRLHEDFERMPATTKSEQRALLRAIEQTV